MADFTPSQRLWKSFKRNKLALFGLIYIALTVLIATLGYLIMPDSTPQANNMTIQLSIKKPGSVFTMLRVRKGQHVEHTGLINKILYGQPDDYTNVPITGYRFIKDSIQVDQYIGDEDKAEKTTYAIYQVINGQGISYNSKGVAKPSAQGATAIAPGKFAGLQNQIVKHQIIRKKYWLGTDLYGRDLLSRIILGARISLAVGLVSVIISLLVGIAVGAAAGYYGGWIDSSLSWLMNVLWALPTLLLVIAISFALGKGLWQIFIAIGISMWVDVARLVRGQVIALKQFEFVEAARALGFGNYRIIKRHILPNIAGPVLVLASSNFASAILLEAGLSFLGFGAQPPMPTWGGMIKEHYGYIIMDAAYLAMLPGLAIMLMVYAFNLITVGLRDAYDVKSQNTRI